MSLLFSLLLLAVPFAQTQPQHPMERPVHRMLIRTKKAKQKGYSAIKARVARLGFPQRTSMSFPTRSTDYHGKVIVCVSRGVRNYHVRVRIKKYTFYQRLYAKGCTESDFVFDYGGKATVDVVVGSGSGYVVVGILWRNAAGVRP
jgi:hypothetical protein